ncbi:hypothetical protein QVN42_12950 [Yersinia nurmii]|uniref:Uncharacterized protein n=1 Tax=Yersinia nurmii TaxID=685706 RepID=A0AAW7K8V2_9GAMM|nr:hypothetical protein [Yersinia nurmii]MDN0088284.1 hypothetical protein [Yersinia nurmii]
MPLYPLAPNNRQASIESQLIANATTPEERAEVKNLFAQIKMLHNVPESQVVVPTGRPNIKNIFLQGLLAQGGMSLTSGRAAPGLIAEHGANPIAQTLGQVRNLQPEIATAPILLTKEIKPRMPRYAVFSPKTTPKPPVLDDVKIVKMFDFSCMNNGENLTFAQILRQIGKTLRQPITMMTVESKNIDSWNKGQGCPTDQQIEEATNITAKVDSITSQLLTFLPGSQPLAIAQYIVGPLLEHAANDLEGKPTSPEEELNLLQQVTQQAKFSIGASTHSEQQRLCTKPISEPKLPQVDLPKFHLKDGVNHIKLAINGKRHDVPLLEHKGKSFAVLPKGKNGGERRQQVYFSHLSQEWKTTGDGKFIRFSKLDQRVAHELSLNSHHRHKAADGNTNVYSVHNPLPSPPQRLQAIELYGRLVPYRYDAASHEQFVYDARQPESVGHKVEYANKEWHIKAPVSLDVVPELSTAIGKYDIQPLRLNEAKLSAPNHFGIQRTSNGKQVLKIDGKHYSISQQGKQLVLGHRNNIPIELASEGGHKVKLGLANTGTAGNKAFNLVDLPIIGKPLKVKMARKVITKSLPMAKAKIQLTLEAMDKPELREQVKLAQKAYFGREFPLKPQHEIILRKTLNHIKSDLEHISDRNFSFDSRVGSKNTVAELSKDQYRQLGRNPNSKIINVGRDGFHTYYKMMGKSKQAVADVLIHELSHGAPNSLDFVYIGTQQQTKVGNVDVFELINLGNNNLNSPGAGQAPESVYAGSDLKDFNSINTSGSKGLKNADSIAQYVSFLSKAERNPDAFNQDYQSLLTAAKNSNDFQQRVEESVPVSRSRRAIESIYQPPSGLLLAIERNSGRYHLYRPL